MGINIISFFKVFYLRLQFVLLGFRPNLASHFARSPSNHSYDYAFSGDRPNCLASLALIPKPFMKYAG